MNAFAKALGFVHWIGISHYLNLLLVGFMVRSGLEILSAHPKLYWRDHCASESEWLRLSSDGAQCADCGVSHASLPEMFHALLAAELVAGWDLLVELANEADENEAKKEFKKRLHEEEEHLVFAPRVVERFAIHEVMGESVSIPTSP